MISAYVQNLKHDTNELVSQFKSSVSHFSFYLIQPDPGWGTQSENGWSVLFLLLLSLLGLSCSSRVLE